MDLVVHTAFIAFLMLFVGIYFTAYNLNSGYLYFSYAVEETTEDTGDTPEDGSEETSQETSE